MASMRTIGRLHQTGAQISKFRKLQQPEPERMKSANSSDLQTDVSALPAPERAVRSRFRRFRLTSPQPEAGSYSLDPSMILSSIAEATPVDRAAQFQALAERERLAEVIRRRLGARGLRGF
jgi:hypothetical protein